MSDQKSQDYLIEQHARDLRASEDDLADTLSRLRILESENQVLRTKLEVITNAYHRLQRVTARLRSKIVRLSSPVAAQDLVSGEATRLAESLDRREAESDQSMNGLAPGGDSI
jgi:hypothetical protein